MESFSNDKLNKKIDVELKKKELEQKYGAYFSRDTNISPEIESEWLNNVEEFERQFNTAERIIVWDYIGKPEYKKVYELETEDISEILEKLLVYLNEHNISLHTLCEVDDRELYRFITEELFFHEIDNIQIEGMMTCFTYEEFHPNAEYDIRSAFEYFFNSTFGKMQNIDGNGYDLLYIDSANYIGKNGEKIDEKKVINTINTFLDSFDYFEIIDNEIKRIYIDNDKTNAKLTFQIRYKGCFNNSQEFNLYEGEGLFKLKPSEYGGWDIYKIKMPGLEI